MTYNIGIVGLGLIGGSLAASLKSYSNHTLYGHDINEDTINHAKNNNFIDHTLTDSVLPECDIIFIALYPRDTVDFIKQNISRFKTNSIIVDLCGVKQFVCENVEQLCASHSLHFIGAHPMAGKEFSGIHYASNKLFQNASIILTPFDYTPKDIIKLIESLCKMIGFSTVVHTTPSHHDEMIALTSQMPHILSNAFIKSPSAAEYKGFTGGSFQDFTRVAKLNSKMWSELFLLNQEALLKELELFSKHIECYKQAIESNDIEELSKLLEEGSCIKENLSNQ